MSYSTSWLHSSTVVSDCYLSLMRSVNVSDDAIQSVPALQGLTEKKGGLFGGQDSPGLRGMIQRPPDCAQSQGYIGQVRLAFDGDGVGFLCLGDLVVRRQ